VTLEEVLAEFKIKPESVACGADCGDGWAPLIRDLIHDLIALGWDRDLAQIKEKFGSLRFYIGSASPEIHERISQAEDASHKICEDCGLGGTTKPWRGGWLRTLCQQCGEQWARL
jgi:hypothetical protein